MKKIVIWQAILVIITLAVFFFAWQITANKVSAVIATIIITLIVGFITGGSKSTLTAYHASDIACTTASVIALITILPSLPAWLTLLLIIVIIILTCAISVHTIAGIAKNSQLSKKFIWLSYQAEFLAISIPMLVKIL